MFQQKTILNGKLPYLINEEKLYLQRIENSSSSSSFNSSNSSSNSFSSFTSFNPYFDCFDILTNNYENSIQPIEQQLIDKNELEGICRCGNKLLVYTNLGSLSFYDLEKLTIITTIINKIKTQKCLTICSSRSRDNLFFTVYHNSTSINPYYVSNSTVTTGTPVRLDILDRNREYITGISCHPSKPYIFVTFARGNVQVWNYTNLRKSLLAKAGDDASGENNNEEDNTNDDNEEQHHSSNKSTANISLNPVSVLLPVQEKSNLATGVTFDSTGRLVAVIWSSVSDGYDHIGVYDVRYSSSSSSSDFKQTSIGSFSLNSDIAKYCLSTCFHPTEPILFIATLKEKGIVTGSTIYALSLLEPNIRIISSHTLDYIPQSISFPFGSNRLIVSSIITSSSSSLSLSSNINNNNNNTNSIVRIISYDFTPEMLKLTKWMKPVISKLSIPPEAFVEGDSILYTKPSTPINNGWPLVLMLHNDLDVFTPEVRYGDKKFLRPMNSFYNLHRIKLNSSSQEKNSTTLIGNIPSIAIKNPIENFSWINIPDDCSLTTPGLFCPDTIKCNEFINGGISENGEWIALLTGYSLYGAPKTTTGKNASLLFTTPVICFIKYTPSTSNSSQSLNTVFGQFKDAIFYIPTIDSNNNNNINNNNLNNSSTSLFSTPFPLTPLTPFSTTSTTSIPVSSTNLNPSNQKQVEILALSQDGTTLLFVPQNNTSSTISTSASTSTYLGRTQLPIKISNLWSTGPNGSNMLLYSSWPQSDNDIQTLYLTAPGMLNFDPKSSTQFSLQLNERVIEVLWQSKSLITTQQNDLQQSRHLFWNESSCGQMVGILTSHRVLLLSIDLILLNQVYHNNIDLHTENINKPDRALSLSWIGRTLIYVCESGAINYLVPSNNLILRPNNLFIRSISQVMGENSGYNITNGRLCTLPTRQTLLGKISIITCLPDRILYATTIDINNQYYMSLMVRPCIPVEPLIIGLIQPIIQKQKNITNNSSDPFSSANINSNKLNLDQLESYRYSLIETLLSIYIPAKPLAGANTSGGALPMTQSTRKLCLALSEAGYTQLVLIAAGICTVSTEGSGADFLRNRWISPGIKFHLALRAGKFAEACNDLISSRPDLQELFIYPESYGGGTLPHRESAYAKQFSSAAYIMAALGQFDMARRLADLAGDEILFYNLLKTSEKNPRKSDIITLKNALKGRSLAYDKIFDIFIQENDSLSSSSSSSIPLLYDIPVVGIGGADRRTTMLSISSPLIDHPSSTQLQSQSQSQSQSQKRSIDLKLIDKFQRQNVINRGGGLGPPTKLGVLAMDSVEDWIGKLRPEVIAADRSHFSSNISGGNNNTNNINENDSFLPTGIDKPETWVDDIGTGKEWDKVVGYWRFSDIIRPGDEDFISSGLPISRINIIDLSKYNTPIEIIADTRNRIQLQLTTSAVDPGEDHTKVKGLNDIVMSIDPYEKNSNSIIQAGLRIPIGRGGPLDIGLFHQDPNRCHMTIEMSIFRCENAVNLPAPINGHCLAKRCCGLGIQDEKHFNNSIWNFYVDNTGALCFNFGSDTKNEIKTSPNEVNMGPTGDINVSVWTHVAVIVDTAQSIGTNNAMVSLFVNGNRSAKGNLHFQPFQENDLALTTLYFGPNLSGWRFTEVRVWADSRPVIDIEGQRDNYLPLASKRKRMQFRIKGSKKLFGPPPHSLDIGEIPSSDLVPVFNIRNRKTIDDDEKETSTNEKSSSSSLSQQSGQLKPLSMTSSGSGNSSGGLAPPIGSKGLAPPGSSSQSSLKGSLAPPSKGGLAPPGGKSLLPSPNNNNNNNNITTSSNSDLSASTTTATSSNNNNNNSNSGLAPPPSKSTGGLAPPTSRGGLAPPSVSSAARNRRASMGGIPDRNLTDVSQQQQQQVESNSPSTIQNENHSNDSHSSDNEVKESNSQEKVESVSLGDNNNNNNDNNESKTLSPSPSTTTTTGLLKAPTAKIAKSRRSSVGSFDPNVVSRSLGIVRSQSGSEKLSTSNDFSIDIAKVTITDVIRCIRRRPLSGGLPLVVVHNSQSIDDSDKIIVIDMPTSNSDSLHFTHHNLSAESAIISPSSLEDTTNRLIAIYKQKKLSLISSSITDPNTNTILGEMPMTLPLIYWSFNGRYQILLMTSNSLFSWDIRQSVIKTSRPIKIIDRVDIPEPKRWAERKVIKLNITPSGWIVIVTCNRVNSSGQPITSYSEALGSYIVSIYHPTTQQINQFYGTTGSIYTFNDENGKEISYLLIYQITSTGREDKVYCIDLENLPNSLPELNDGFIPIKNLIDLVNENSPPSYIKWSISLQLTKVYLGSIPPTVLPGTLIVTIPNQTIGYVLNPLGELFYINLLNGEILRTIIVSEEFIFTSGYNMMTTENNTITSENEHLIYLLTGTQGRIVRVVL